jgi:hypothetical protein
MMPGLAMMLTMSLLALGQTLGRFEAAGARAVVFPPWLDRGEVWARIAAADGVVAREGRWPFIMVVKPASENFSQRIRAFGAWLELDPMVVADCTQDERP